MSAMIKPGTLIAKQYEIGKRIGSGGFGRVYIAYDMQDNGNKVAIKIHNPDAKRFEASDLTPASTPEDLEKSEAHPDDKVAKKMEPSLEFKSEYWALQHLENYPGFPQVYKLGVHQDQTFIVMELLGKSIWDLFIERKLTFPLKTQLLLMDQCLERIEHMHDQGIVHGDIKPENMVMGVGKNSSTLYFIDLGLAAMHWNYEEKSHVECDEKNIRPRKAQEGTLPYMSTNVHAGLQKSRRDDLENLAYTFAVFLTHNNLPWHGMTDIQRKEMGIMKLNMKGDTLFKGYPKEFAVFYEKIRKLKFKEVPDYYEYRNIFRMLGASLGVNYDLDLMGF